MVGSESVGLEGLTTRPSGPIMLAQHSNPSHERTQHDPLLLPSLRNALGRRKLRDVGRVFGGVVMDRRKLDRLERWFTAACITLSVVLIIATLITT